MPRKSSRRKFTEPALTVELPEDMLRSIDRLAHQARITRSDVIRDLVGKALAADAPAFAVQRNQSCKVTLK